MKRSSLTGLYSFLFILLSLNAQATPPTLGLSLLESPEESGPQQAYFEAHGSAYTRFPDLTRKFENDNLIVQFYHPSVNTQGITVVNQNVSLALPPLLNYDALMEALIKVRTARTLGALEVSVFSQIPLEEIRIEGHHAQELHLRDLFAVAGADVAIEAGHRSELHPQKIKKNAASQKEYWIGGLNHPELLAEISDHLGQRPLSFEAIQTRPQECAGRSIYWVAAAELPINERFFSALGQAAWMSRHGARVHLITPYLFYSRSDKPEFEVGVTTQGRLVADLIEAVGVQGITVVRAHAPQSLGFFRIHSKEITSRPTIIDFLKTNAVDCVISPDAGFQKDATKFQHELTLAYQGAREVNLVVMNKERNYEGKERILGGTGIEHVTGKTLVIVDDETASGGTLDQVAQILQRYQPKRILAVVTHLAGHAKKAIESPAIEHIVVTNTLPIKAKSEKLTVLSIAQEIAQEIAHSEANRHF